MTLAKNKALETKAETNLHTKSAQTAKPISLSTRKDKPLVEDAIGLKTMAAISVDQLAFAEAIEYGAKAAKLFEQLSQPMDQMECLLMIGRLEMERGATQSALDRFMALLKISCVHKTLIYIGHAHRGIGAVHLVNGRYRLAKDAFFDALEMVKEIDTAENQQLDRYQLNQAELLLHLSQAFYGMEEFGEAIRYGNQAIEAAQSDGILRCRIRNVVSQAMLKIGKVARAATLLINNLSFLKEGIDPITKIESHRIYADLLLYQTNLKEARIHLLRGLTLAEKCEQTKEEARFHMTLASLYKEERDFEKALYHFETFYKMRLENS